MSAKDLFGESTSQRRSSSKSRSRTRSCACLVQRLARCRALAADGTKQARERYKRRAATAETLNAGLRTWRALKSVWVRGQAKVLCVALLSALSFSLVRALALGAIGGR
jgi:hypothetical protein